MKKAKEPKSKDVVVATPNDRAITTFRKEALIALFSAKKRGDFISWEDIAGVCEKEEREVLAAYICMIRPVLEECCGYFILNERDRGYKIAEGDEQRKVVTAQWKAALLRAFTCEERVDYIDRKSLTGSEVAMLEKDKAHMQRVNGICRKAMRDTEIERRKKHDAEFVGHTYPVGRSRRIQA